MADMKIYKNGETLKTDITFALYDLMKLKKKSTAEANAIVKNAVSRPELITEYTLLRALVRLSIAHKHRGTQMPKHWAERLSNLRKEYPADVKHIRREVEEISRLEKEAKKTKGPQPRRTRPR